MLISHGGKSPKIDQTAWVAPDATVCGDVTIGPGTGVMPGAWLIGEGGGRISIGRGMGRFSLCKNGQARGTD